MASEDVEILRRIFSQQSLSDLDVDADPLRQFKHWFEVAVRAKIPNPEAMALATSTNDAIPSVRMVLMKKSDEHGFVFFTNYESRKGRELAQNPHAALLFHWAELERQVRIEGTITEVSREESEEYFHSRPRESQISTWASQQSNPLKNRQELNEHFERLKFEYNNQEIPLPKYWGGYRLTPIKFEFWQGRANRLHDRILYTYEKGSWKIIRLAP